MKYTILKYSLVTFLYLKFKENVARMEIIIENLDANNFKIMNYWSYKFKTNKSVVGVWSGAKNS